MKTNANAPAAPVVFEHSECTAEMIGLTKREKMALDIMCALIMDPSSDSNKDAVAGMAVQYADALLRQLEASSVE